MPVDYDLVVIGNTAAATQAAIAAANLKARVALVTQQRTVMDEPELLTVPALANLSRTVDQMQQLQAFPGWQKPTLAPREALRWDWATVWMDAIAMNLNDLRSPASLAQFGVDVIDDCGEFCRKPSPGFRVGRRFLKSRRYLIAVGASPAIPTIAGLQNIRYATLHTLAQELPTWKPSSRVAIIGEDVNAIAVAQTLTKLGFSVCLLQFRKSLATADQQVMRWMQAQLEAAGIEVVESEILKVEPTAAGMNIQTEAGTIAVDHLVVAEQTVDGRSLNLEAVGVNLEPTELWQNEKLQTQNPNIYLCCGRLGCGYFSHVASYEAQIAVKNALFFPRLKADYRQVPVTIATDPEVAWVGITEAEAVRYGKQVLVVSRSFNALPQAQLHSDLSGFCKLIGHRNGRILGAHIVGTQAREWIGVIALAMQQNLKMSALATVPLPSPSYAEIVRQTAIAWQQQQLRRGKLRDGLDMFFDWRRSL
jgi:pyruvate/2-oxoglutarate dehydrogenase complex dihydrolipoamide dehydrogenase (E3) component